VPGLRVTPTVTIPEADLSWRAVRSSGPGGQNVNKVASKVELRVDLARIEGLSGEARARLAEIARTRLDAGGWLLVTSQRTRDQGRNLEDAREKVRTLLLRSLERPRPRVPSRPTAAARSERIREKKVRARRKRVRARVRPEEE
jgi:ribosome-associated protein